jgi:adenine-specific DNA-methyltransferase
LEDYVDFAAVEVENPGSKSWIAYDKQAYALIKKIIEKGKPLKDWDIVINRGVLTGYNEAFIIDTTLRDKLVAEDPRSAEIIKPILRGEDIKAYVPEWAGLWIINTHNGNKGDSTPRIDAENNYPAVYNWLSSHQKALEKRYDKGDHWTNLRNCAYINEFLKPKIIYPNMTKFMPFVYDKDQFFTNQKCFIVTGQLLGYLTAFFNSSLFRFAFKEYFPELLGDTRELSKVFFETVTVLPVDETTNTFFESAIEKIISMKKNGQNPEQLEQEIAVALYKVYGLSDYEIQLIESASTADKTEFPSTIERSTAVSP